MGSAPDTGARAALVDAVPGSAVRRTAICLGAVLAFACGTAASTWPLWSGVAVVVAAGLGLAAVRPDFAISAFVAAVYLRVPQAGVDYLGLPTAAHAVTLFAAVLGMFAWWRRRSAPAALLPALALVAGVIGAQLLSSFVARSAPLALGGGYHVLGDASVAVAVVLLLRTPRALICSLWSIVAAAALVSSIGLYQFLYQDFSHEFGGLGRRDLVTLSGDATGYRIAGQLGDPNFFAQALVLALPAALTYAVWAPTRAARLVARLAAVLISTTTVLTFSRGGLLAMLLVLALAAARFRPRPPALVGAGLIALAVAPLLPGAYLERLTSVTAGAASSTSDASVVERAHGLETAARMTAANPLLGVGHGNYSARVREYAPSSGLTEPRDPLPPHSLFLATSAETGAIGLTALLALVVWALRGPRRLEHADDDLLAASAWAVRAGVLGFFAAALFLPPAYGREMWLTLGLGLATLSVAEQVRARPVLHVVRAEPLPSNAGAGTL